MKVLVTERIAEEGIKYLLDNGFEVDTRYGISQDELLGIIGGYDAIIVRSVTKVNAQLLEKATNLKVAGRAGNGIDNIDVATYPGWASTLVVNLLFNGIMLIILGIIGEYVGRIYDEAKGRPLYIVRETINMDDIEDERPITKR